MCLILFSYLKDKEYKLILAANRDEFYERPTAPAEIWQDHDGLVAGRDLRAGGTWLGIHPSGKYGMVTNYRDPVTETPRLSSRGHVVLDFVKHKEKPQSYLEQLHSEADFFNGYNTLLGDNNGLWYYSNKVNDFKQLHPGVYGLSNHLLDTAWPKVVRGKALFESVINKGVINVEDLFHILKDDRKARDHELPETGVPLEWERTLSSMFIRSEGYGTRCSSIILIRHEGQIDFYERTYPTDGSAPATVHFTLPPTRS